MPKWLSSSPRSAPTPKRFSILSTVIFFGSLGLTAYSFLAEKKPPLDVSLAASGALLAVKLIIDWTGKRRAARAKA